MQDASVSVVAGSSVTLPLACTGWRPDRQVTTAPSKGTLGAIDQEAGTVTYTAGDVAGSDSVVYQAGNGVGRQPGRDGVGHRDARSRWCRRVVRARACPLGRPGLRPTDAAPVISAVTLSPASVKRAKLRTPVLRFTLSEAASVTVTLERLVPGRRAKGRCVTKPAPKPRAPGTRCTSAVRVSRATKSAPAGAAKLRISLKRGPRRSRRGATA